MADEHLSRSDRIKRSESRARLNMTSQERANADVNDWVHGDGQLVLSGLLVVLVLGLIVTLFVSGEYVMAVLILVAALGYLLYSRGGAE